MSRSGNGIQAHEMSFSPRSRQKLDQRSAVGLADYLAQLSDLNLGNLFPEICHLLWIVDENGDL